MFCSTYKYSILTLLIFLTSCAQDSQKDLIVLQEVEKTTKKSNHILNNNIDLLVAYFQKGATDPIIQGKVEVWLPKVLATRDVSKNIITYIDSLQKEISQFKGHDDNVTQRSIDYFVKKEKGKQLFERLVTYRRNILAIDSIIYQGINDLSFIEAGSLVSQNKKEEFVDLYFKKTSHKGINALLTNFSSNIKQNEYKIILLFREQWSGYFMENFIQYSTLIGQNSTHIRKGEKIEIIAGLGSFNIQIIPTITIDNKLMKLNDYGAAVYTKIPKKNSGKLSIPVVIEFVDKYGAKQKIKKLVEFVVDN